MNKICRDCKQDKPASLWPKKGSYCKACRSRRQCEYQKRSKAIVNAKNKKWQQANPEKFSQQQARWYAANRDHAKARNKTWRQNNPGKMRAYTRAYQADKITACPKWLTDKQKSEITAIYETCPPGYHVDHILPLRGKTVCGLHVPWNLQHLPAERNRKKSNKFPASQ